MQIIIGPEVKVMTGYKNSKAQQKWFAEQGINFKVNAEGKVWTTDDWLNGKDKYKPANDDDGFNMEFIKNA